MNDSYRRLVEDAGKGQADGGVHRHRRSGQARAKIWAELQALFYEQVPAIKVGDAYSYDIASKKLKGMGDSTVLWPHFWNVSY